MMATILNSSILNSAILDSAILHIKLWLKLVQSDSNSFILTQLDDISHLEFCHHGFSYFAQKKTLLIHSDSTWWWQPSWILPCWIQTLPSWIQTPWYLLSDSLKNTLPPLWLWLKLIPIWLTWWWQPSWILPSWILPSWIQPFCIKLWLKLIQSD